MENFSRPTDVVSCRDWVVTLILSGMPGLNIVLFFFWSLSKKTKPSKKNYARASLLLIFIVLLIYLITIEATTGYFLFKHY